MLPEVHSSMRTLVVFIIKNRRNEKRELLNLVSILLFNEL